MGESPTSLPIPWQDVAAAKRKEIDTLISTVWTPPEDLPSNQIQPYAIDLPQRYLTPSEREITENYTAEQLLVKIASRDFSAEDVARAYCKRAAIAHKLVCCLSNDHCENHSIHQLGRMDNLRRRNCLIHPDRSIVSAKSCLMLQYHKHERLTGT